MYINAQSDFGFRVAFHEDLRVLQDCTIPEPINGSWDAVSDGPSGVHAAAFKVSRTDRTWLPDERVAFVHCGVQKASFFCGHGCSLNRSWRPSKFQHVPTYFEATGQLSDHTPIFQLPNRDPSSKSWDVNSPICCLRGKTLSIYNEIWRGDQIC